MRTIAILSLLLLTSTAFGELTKEDIRTIIREEIAASEKRTREYIDLKVDGVEKSLNTRIDAVEKGLNARIDGLDQRIDDANEPFDPFWIVMIIILTAVILPQIIVLFLTIYDERKWSKDIKSQIQQLCERINALENTPSMNP